MSRVLPFLVALGIAAISVVLPAQACELVINNDSGSPAMVLDRNTNQRLWIMPMKTRTVGDPNERADFTLHTQKTLLSVKPERYEVKQIACSPNHKITLMISDIIRKNVDPTLFIVSKQEIKPEEESHEYHN